MTLLVDAVATDDEYGGDELLVCQGDGLDLRTLAALWRHYRQTRSPEGVVLGSQTATVSGARSDLCLPEELVQRLDRLASLQPAPGYATRPPTGEPSASTAVTSQIDLPCGDVTTRDRNEVGVWRLDASTSTVTYDAVGAQLIGAGHHAGHDRVDNHLERLLHPDDRTPVADSLQRALRTGQDCQLRFRVIAADGSCRWLISHARVLDDPHVDAAQLVGMIRADDDGPGAS